MTISIQAAIIISVIMILSLAMNAVLVYYTRVSIVKFMAISEGIGSLRDSIVAFTTHLKFVYELEMYYGDETLKALIEHARTLSSSFDEYEEFYDLFDFEFEEDEEEELDAAQTQEG